MSDNLQPLQVPESQKIVKINEAALDQHLDRKVMEADETTPVSSTCVRRRRG